VVLGDLPSAREAYARAAAEADRRFADLASTRRQARLLLDHLGQDRAWLESVLAVPPVLAFTGHMIDRPDRASPRFPASLESTVRDRIREHLDRIDPVAAYGSAASGTDILCLEAVLDRGGEAHVVLPFPPDEFRKVSVDPAGADWGRRFEQVLHRAATVLVTSDHRAEGSESTFQYANLVLTGMAELRAGVLESSVTGLAVWDGLPAGGAGGTGDVVDLWRERGYDIVHLDPTGPAASAAPSDPAREGAGRSEAPSTGRADGFSHELRAMLFADAVGYSKLTENQVRVFIARFLGAIAGLNSRTDHHPIHMETAGDGLYFVFSDARDAGRYALELSTLVRDTDWEAEGLPPTMNMRIGLHCGPVFHCRDPITGLEMYTGPHTSRTARIEPITPPGQVYASSAFAAVAAATGVTDLSFSYVGRTNLAKKYGALALYHVHR
jgi:hypothetical protein